MSTRRVFTRSMFALLSAAALAGCSGDEGTAQTTTEPEVRMEVTRPGDPTRDAGLPYEEDMPGDMDMGVTPPEDMAPADMTPTCPPDECAFGQGTCVGEQIRECVQDANGCIVFGEPLDCPLGETCSTGRCQPANGCIDNDFDGYGTGCFAGPDCADDDPDRNPSRDEICDGKDNNCSGVVDDVAGVGMACASGVGECAAMGTSSCDPASGMLVCTGGTPGMPTAETCDGKDNDCDGQIDNGGVCPTASCAQDNQEPNDTMATAFNLAANTRIIGLTCSGDKEYFKLTGLMNNKSYRVNLAFPDSLSDLDLKLYEDGTLLSDAASASDHEQLDFTAKPNKEYIVEVENYDQKESFYLLNVTDTYDCSGDDAFENNNDINSSPYLVSGWRTDAYMCADAQDWYYLGDLAANTQITVNLYFWTSFLFGEGDLDAVILGPTAPMGTTVDVVATGAASGDDESFSHTVVNPGVHFLVVAPKYSGESNDYEVMWTRTP